MLDETSFDHERLEVFRDAATGVTGAVAIHSTVLGPAMGGLRLHAYSSLDDVAIDALRLARAMTLKNSAAGLDLGGGKAVLLDDGGWSRPADRAERMRAVGRIVDELHGAYVTAEDVGTSPQDMEHIAATTRWVAGRPVDRGGRGDPSPATARTVFGAIEAAVRSQLGAADLAGVRVGVQGAGHVGSVLVALLREAGAEVALTDVVAARAMRVAETTGARVVEGTGFLRQEFEVLAPCAMGESISAADVPALRCAIVAGAANNPLAADVSTAALAAAGILYVPDFIANCGGIIHVGGEMLGLGDAEVERLIAASIERTGALLRDAQLTGRTPHATAVDFAEARIAGALGATRKVAA